MDPAFFVPLAAFVGTVALVGAIVSIARHYAPSKAEDRLAVMTGKKSASDSVAGSLMKEEVFLEGKAGLSALIRAIGKRFENLQLIFEQANSPLKPEMFVLVCFGSGLVFGALSVIAYAPMPLVPVVGVFGAAVPCVWLWLRRSMRLSKFEKQLPNALDLIGRAIRSGHSLAAGLKVVVDEMPAPIGMEFGIAYEQQNLGISVEQSLQNMLIRVPNMDLQFFVIAVTIQRQSGGDLAEILDKISDIVRERFKILGQVKALTGEGRVSGVVLMALPIALFFAVYYINPDYVMLLFTDPVGRKMIAFATFMQLLGAFVIRKIITIKV